MLQQLENFWSSLPPDWRAGAISTGWIIIVTVALILSVAYLTLVERKVLGWMQLRRGPNRVRIFGLAPGWGQPFADVFKLLTKEVVIPTNANKLLFRVAPAIALVPAFATWAVVPLSPNLTVANIDAGLLYVLSLTSAGVYGVILAGWAANSKYAFLGAMRSAAQIVAYEIAMGFALVCVLMVSQSLNLVDIVDGQNRGYFAHKGLDKSLFLVSINPNEGDAGPDECCDVIKWAPIFNRWFCFLYCLCNNGHSLLLFWIVER